MNHHGASQKFAATPSSTNLADNLESVIGYKKIKGSEAYHIIPKSEAGAGELREMMEVFGIHLDDASNGTFMVGPNTRHQFRENLEWLDGLGAYYQNHGNSSKYLSQLNSDLAGYVEISKQRTPTAAEVERLKNELQKIASKVANGEYKTPTGELAWP